MKPQSTLGIVRLLALILLAGLVLARIGLVPVMAAEGGHKLAIQVSDDNPASLTIALNNATNVIKMLGPANVDVEIVAYGPGLKMFHKDSKLQARLASLHAFGNVKYAVCGNTMKKLKWSKNDLLQDAFVQDAVVPAGVVRLMELQEQGYSYIKP